MLDLVIDWIKPKTLDEITYTDLVGTMQNNLEKKENKFASRFGLFTMEQGEKSLQDHISEVIRVVGRCKYEKGANPADENGVIAILRSINSAELRQYLLNGATDISTMEKCREAALVWEQNQAAAKMIDKQKVDVPKPAVHKNVKGNQLQVDSDSDSERDLQHLRLHQMTSMQSEDCKQAESDIPWIEETLIPPLMVDIKLDGVPIRFEHDSGADITVINRSTWEKIGKPKLKRSVYRVFPFGAETQVEVIGKTAVVAEYKGEQKRANVLVTEKGDSLLGKTWIRGFRIRSDDYFIKKVETTSKLHSLLKEYEDIFQEDLGKCTMEVNLKLKEGAKPKFIKARTLPFGLRKKVEEQLQAKVDAGILKPVQHSRWGSPIVVVPKPNNEIRICGDYKKTLNPNLDVNQYPLPKIETLLHELQGGKVFSKLDLRDAFHQLPLDEHSKELTTITTHKGLFQSERLAFGVASAPAIFQNTVEKVLQGIEGAIEYMDDVTFSAPTEDEHLGILRQVFQRFREYGLKLKREKCDFLKHEIEFLGYIINADGHRISERKLEGLKKMPYPENVKQLESFLGFMNYYGKFVKNFAWMAAPLNDLKKKDVPWIWTEVHKNAFDKIKEILLQRDALTHFDPDKDVVLATDACEYGIGAVISHREKDGTERVIANASRKLTAAERNYAQIEKEALAIVYGVEKFRDFLLGRKFILQTDHQPLVRIFGDKSDVGSIAMKRLTRWSIILDRYDYQIEYVRTEDFGNADGLSRLPNPDEEPLYSETMFEKECLKLYRVKQESSPLRWSEIEKFTKNDPILSKVLSWIREGFPGKVEKKWKTWWEKRDEMTSFEGVVLFRDKPVIPEAMKNDVLQLLHSAHVGEKRMLSIARQNFWMEGLTTLVKNIAKSCEICNSCKKEKPSKTHPWEKPDEFWDRIHIDYAGPFQNAMWLVVVDAYSNWIEVEKTAKSDTKSTIKLLRSMFLKHGLPQTIVSDNGTSFTSQEFQEFCEIRGIKHVLTPPYHPQSNGQAERAVRTFKEWTERFLKEGLRLEEAVAKMLLVHRTTSNAVSEASPAEKAFGRKFRTKLTVNAVKGKEIEEAEYKQGEKVWVRAYHTQDKW
uniref:Reverse transcriptase n=1 Tax=Panagrolaimus sp. JU765 TaxID=591449 RepID=A0AC34QC54_9BILA